MKSTRPLKLSDLGSKVRFVKLETTDSTLIGGEWKALAHGDKLLVGNTRSIMTAGENLGRAMTFDLNTGHFLNYVGNQGQGPGEYAFPSALGMNPATGTAYFTGSNFRGWVAYDLDGKFNGPFLTDTTIEAGTLIFTAVGPRGPVMRKHVMGPTREFILYNYSPSGELLDSTVMMAGVPGPERKIRFDGRVSFFSHNTPLNNTVSEVISDGYHQAIIGGRVYPIGSEIHYHEYLCDTVYNLTDGCRPALVFSLGPDFMPIEKLSEEWFSDNDLIVTDVIETPDKVVFGLSRGWLGEEGHEEFVGVFDRASGTTAIGPAKEAFADDITGFMPIIPRQVFPDGTIAAWLTMEHIEEWLEENPDAKRPDWLGDANAEDNPVLVLIN